MSVLLACVAAFAIGFAQVFFVASQTLSLSQGRTGRRIFLQSLAISSVWSLGVLAVSRHGWTGIPYAIGAACGATTAARFGNGKKATRKRRARR